MNALIACSQPSEIDSWYNIRVLAEPQCAPTPDTLVQVLLQTRATVKDMVALDLGWTRGEWMVKIQDPKRVSQMHDFGKNFRRGLFIGGFKGTPDIEFIINPVSLPSEMDCKSPVRVPIVLMGIPYYDSDIDLGLYLFEAITAQNKELGIQSVEVRQRYKIGGARTNDVRCHVTIDPACVHKWDLEKPMKIVIQGWDNEGVPRPEMWPVTMRYVDECLTCGGFYHYDNDGLTVVDCKVLESRDVLMRRRECSLAGRNQTAHRPVSAPLDQRTPATPDPSAPTKTNIGFIVAT